MNNEKRILNNLRRTVAELREEISNAAYVPGTIETLVEDAYRDARLDISFTNKEKHILKNNGFRFFQDGQVAKKIHDKVRCIVSKEDFESFNLTLIKNDFESNYDNILLSDIIDDFDYYYNIFCRNYKDEKND